MVLTCFAFKGFELEICTILHATTPNKSLPRRKTPTLDAIVTLSNDGSKRADFVAQDGSKQQVVTQDLYSLVTNIAKCFRIKVSW